MKKQIYRRSNILLIACGLVLIFRGCSYPFTPEGIRQESGILCIEGDILIGDTSWFKVSESLELDNALDGNLSIKVDELWVEDEQGNKYLPYLYRESEEYSDRGLLQAGYYIDTKNLPTDRKYKLCAVRDGVGRIETPLMEVSIASAIGEIGYKYNNEDNTVDIYLTTEVGTESGNYYRWKYDDIWEVHATYYSRLYVNPTNYSVYRRTEISPGYQCWSYGTSKEVMFANTASMEVNKLDSLKLYSIPYSDNKISVLYYTNVKQYSITEDAYKFWESIKINSENIGGIFAPQPSEMRGNLTLLEDPDRFILGYISASTVQTKSCYIDDGNVYWYDYFSKYRCETIRSTSAPTIRYISDMLKARYDLYDEVLDGMTTYYLWADIRCTDCRSTSTKRRPSDWRNPILDWI